MRCGCAQGDLRHAAALALAADPLTNGLTTATTDPATVFIKSTEVAIGVD
jgi:hypothetical protein